MIKKNIDGSEPKEVKFLIYLKQKEFDDCRTDVAFVP